MIVAAAIKYNGVVYSLPPPARHNHIILHAIKQGVKPPINRIMGFLISTGEFIGREEAARIAFQSGQIVSQIPTLFTEDLW